MRRKRRTFSSEFNLKVILDSLKEREFLSELSQKYELHQNQISKWKNDFIDSAKTNLVASNNSQENFKWKLIFLKKSFSD